MSIKHMSDVWANVNLTSSEKLVALAIADCANDDGLAYPGYKNLMKKTGIRSKVTISKIIKSLRKKEWCTWSNKSAFGAGKKVNLYQISPKSTETVLPRPKPLKQNKSTETVLLPQSTETVPPKVQKLYPKSTETVHETSVETSVKENRQSFAQESFEKFWSSYPKKRSKGQARKAWSKIKMNQSIFESIMAGISRATQSDDWQKENGKYIPYPASWLNGEMWDDEFESDLPGHDEITPKQRADMKARRRAHMQSLESKNEKRTENA